jgi:dipeptidase D
MSFVADLEPRAVWRHFDQILTIPRGSGNEAGMRRHVQGFAERAGLVARVDVAGNVVVRKPATAGNERAPGVILQAHLDMVNEKRSDVAHDFTRDPLIPRRDGDYLTATGTTLGSDNGIGVAAMLAVLEAGNLVHGPLECLFTIDEETGLTGAGQLDPTLLSGRLLLNLDSEEEGILYVGCAGGGDTTVTLPLRTTTVPAGGTALRLRLHGLKGGHSGVDIRLQRGNAIKLLVRVLGAGAGRASLHLADVSGGGAHNAIPREAVAVVVVAERERAVFEDAVRREFAAAAAEYRPADPGMALDIAPGDAPAAVWEHASATTALRLLAGLPHGVLAMSYAIPDLVETSTNVATVAQRDGALVIGTSTRSSIDTALAAARARIRAIAELAGAKVDEHAAYPGWQPNLASPLLEVVKRVYRTEFGAESEVKAIHAGLECGIIGKKIPGVDMISFGPQIEFPHSPDERVAIPSVGNFYRLLGATLAALVTN